MPKALLFLIVFTLFLCLTICSRSYKDGMTKYFCKKKLKYNSNGPLYDLCLEGSSYFSYSMTGFKNGLLACRDAFKHERWNCTTHDNNSVYKLFGTVMARGELVSISNHCCELIISICQVCNK